MLIVLLLKEDIKKSKRLQTLTVIVLVVIPDGFYSPTFFSRKPRQQGISQYEFPYLAP
jgi:hypothetical protein